MAVKSEKNLSIKSTKLDEPFHQSKGDEAAAAAAAEKAKLPFTCRQKLSLCMLASADFMSFCMMSIMAPFFPKEAESKGMSETVAGLVFGFYALIMFIFSPIVGKLLPKIGVKFSFIAGILLSGVCCIVFGLLQYVEDSFTFTVLSFAIRGLEAIGTSGYSTASYVIVVNIFPNNGSTVRGILETFVGLGLSVGPAVGGLLFAAGGFGLPFYIMGVVTLLLAPLNIWLLQSGEECKLDKSCASMMMLLKQPKTIMVCVITMVVSITWSFLDPTLEPRLREFSLTPTYVGLIFLLLSSTYAVACPISGWFADRMPNSYWILMAAGLFLSSFCLLLLGPCPMLTFLEDSLWLNIVSLSALGVSVGLALMPTFQGVLDGAVDAGLDDSLGTNSIVAGVWSSVYSLGEVVGPVTGGALLEHYGFAFTATFIAVLNLATAVGATMFFVVQSRSSKCDGDISTKDGSDFKKQPIETICMTNGKYLHEVSAP